ncbi:MAG: epoxyqueuosine reductase [Syntrophaceae bacterium]|nr:epoxyqueuosine reductase [Syntrophaceae bacterium]
MIQPLDLAKWIVTSIRDFVHNSPENTLRNETNEKAWDDPLVGFSRGDDHLYEDYKKYVGPFHWTPREIFLQTFPEIKVVSNDLTVISWILPHTEATKADNRKEKTYPAQRWARARHFGEAANNKLRGHVIAVLKTKGYRAVAPVLSVHWTRKISDLHGLASTWSERHVAYASGLGTFGLCDGLITARGKAMRAGSVVAQIHVPPTPRLYNDHHAYCLFYARGTCKKCISRCPVGAISETGHDKQKCGNYTHGKSRDYISSHYGFGTDACGLCQTKVPCESKNPTMNP